jgi:hypothetical protein
MVSTIDVSDLMMNYNTNQAWYSFHDYLILRLNRLNKNEKARGQSPKLQGREDNMLIYS